MEGSVKTDPDELNVPPDTGDDPDELNVVPDTDCDTGELNISLTED